MYHHAQLAHENIHKCPQRCCHLEAKAVEGRGIPVAAVPAAIPDAAVRPFLPSQYVPARDGRRRQPGSGDCHPDSIPADRATTHALDFPVPARERRRCSVATTSVVRIVCLTHHYQNSRDSHLYGLLAWCYLICPLLLAVLISYGHLFVMDLFHKKQIIQLHCPYR